MQSPRINNKNGSHEMTVDKFVGEVARLIPVVAETSKEQRLVSVTLAMMTHIPEFSRQLLSTVGVRIGKWSKIEAFTEIRFPDDDSKNDRPDGLIVVSTGRSVWRAIVEAKVGSSPLVAEQVQRYVDLAKRHKVDAVITISNEFNARIDHHPTLTLRRADARYVGLFHWPWSWVRAQAYLIQIEESLVDREQIFLLNELHRFLEHPSTGIESFNQMPSEWKAVIGEIREKVKLNKNSKDVEAVVAAWQQEVRDLAIKMASHVGMSVDVKLSKKQKADPAEWLKDGCAQLASSNCLSCSLEIPDTAGDLEITTDLLGRSIQCVLRVAAPKDRKSTSARVNWLLRQIKSDDQAAIAIKAIRPGKAQNSQKLVSELRVDSTAIELSSPDTPPTAFEVVHTRDLGGTFSANRKFIEELERTVPAFYDNAMQYVNAWQPRPPKPVEKVKPSEIDPIELSDC